MNCELPEAELEKAEEPEVKLVTSIGSLKSKRSGKPCFIDCAKAFDCVDHDKLWEILKETGIQTTFPASWETCVRVKNQQLELDMEQQTGSK